MNQRIISLYVIDFVDSKDNIYDSLLMTKAEKSKLNARDEMKQKAFFSVNEDFYGSSFAVNYNKTNGEKKLYLDTNES